MGRVDEVSLLSGLLQCGRGGRRGGKGGEKLDGQKGGGAGPHSGYFTWSVDALVNLKANIVQRKWPIANVFL